MGFDNFITDKVNFYNENGELKYENLGIQLNSNGSVNIGGIDKLFEKGYFFIRKINNFIEEKYLITKVDYQNHPKDSFRLTKLVVEKEGDSDLSKSIISAGTHIHAGGDIIIGNNNKNTINEIDKFIDLLNLKNIDRKDDIIKLLEEYKKTQNNNNLVDVFSILGNGASMSSLIIALSSLVN